MSDPNMPGVHTTLGIKNKDTIAMAYEVANAARAAGHQLYFVFAIGPTGDHLHGFAVDYSVYDDGTVKNPGRERPAVGDWVAAYVWANRLRLGVRYIIWNRRIISRTGTPPNVWLPYHGTPDPHTNHVHVSRLHDARPYSPPPSSGGGTTQPPGGTEVASNVHGRVVFKTPIPLTSKAKVIPLVDEDSPSILSEDQTGDGAIIFNGGVSVRVAGLTAPGQVFGALVVYDSKGARVGQIPGGWAEAAATPGATYLRLNWPYVLGKNRRLRLEMSTDQAAGVSVEQVNSSFAITKGV